MDAIHADYSISMSEFKKNPAQVLRTAGEKPVAVLNHNRPAAYLLSPEVYESMLERLNADLRATIQEGIDSGPAIAAEDVFAELTARYAEPKSATKPATKTSSKRST